MLLKLITIKSITILWVCLSRVKTSIQYNLYCTVVYKKVQSIPFRVHIHNTTAQTKTLTKVGTFYHITFRVRCAAHVLARPKNLWNIQTINSTCIYLIHFINSTCIHFIIPLISTLLQFITPVSFICNAAGTLDLIRV